MNTDHQNISYEFDRPHKAWVYSYGLSLAKGFTFAMTLVRSQLVHLTHFFSDWTESERLEEGD